MPTVVGVRFKKACKVYYFDPADTGVAKGDHAIVETARGVEYGEVVLGPREMPDALVVQPLKPVIRKATEQDDNKVFENAVREREAFHICERRIQKHGLEMHLVDVEFTFDVNKIIFYFTADGRVDFRELVKDLASVFRTRIELHQIGVRDEAKMMGGIGYCGRPLCCATFLGDFEPVSIRMAKNQNLSLNPTKISGICGRLMCCLKYEDYLYDKKRNNGKPELGQPGCPGCPALNADAQTRTEAGRGSAYGSGERSERAERPERGERRDGARPERGERAARAERSERGDRVERTERRERRSERGERNERTERRSERNERNEHAERGERTERRDRRNRRREERTDRPVASGAASSETPTTVPVAQPVTTSAPAGRVHGAAPASVPQAPENGGNT